MASTGISIMVSCILRSPFKCNLNGSSVASLHYLAHLQECNLESLTNHLPEISNVSLCWLLCVLRLQLLPMALLYMATVHGPRFLVRPETTIGKECCGPQVCCYANVMLINKPNHRYVVVLKVFLIMTGQCGCSDMTGLYTGHS